MALLETLTDNFDDNSTDTGKWTSFATGSASTAEANQQVEVTLPSGVGGSSYGGYVSNTSYDLTGSYGYLKLVEVGSVSTNAQTYYKLYVDGSNYVQWLQEAGTIYAQKRVAGTPTNVGSNTYDAATYRFLRIREASGTTYWDYSADGVNWSNFANQANPITVTALSAEFGGGTYQSEASPGKAIWDNFNVAPDATTTSTSSTSSSTSSTSTSKSTSTSSTSTSTSISTSTSSTSKSTSTSFSTSSTSTSTSVSTSSTSSSTSISTSSTSTSASTSLSTSSTSSSTSTSVSTSSTSTSQSTSTSSTSTSTSLSTSSTSASTSVSTSSTSQSTSTSLSTSTTLATTTSTSSTSTSSTSSSTSSTTTLPQDPVKPWLRPFHDLRRIRLPKSDKPWAR